MKINKQLTLAAAVLALAASATVAMAQDNNDAPPPGGPDQRGPGMRGHRPPVPAIVNALDANHDGVIDADEIANASAALKTLDKNGDGKLTPNEFMGPRPHMRGGERPGGRRMGHGGNDNNPPAGPPPGDDMNGGNPAPDAPAGDQ